MFPNLWVDKAVLTPSDMLTLSKHPSTLVFMIVFGIQCNFLIVLPIRLKNCISNVFFSSYKAKYARPLDRGRLRGFAHPSAPDRHRAHNLSRPEVLLMIWFCFDVAGKNSFDMMLINVESLHKKWSFPLRISSVNVTKSAVLNGVRNEKKKKNA